MTKSSKLLKLEKSNIIVPQHKTRNMQTIENIYKNLSRASDYESEGRAFESLRVRHISKTYAYTKLQIVPLSGNCTSISPNSCQNTAIVMGVV